MKRGYRIVRKPRIDQTVMKKKPYLILELNGGTCKQVAIDNPTGETTEETIARWHKEMKAFGWNELN